MKKIFFIFLFVSLLLTVVCLPAQNKVDVKLKFNKQDGLTRIVFEAEEMFIQKIKMKQDLFC